MNGENRRPYAVVSFPEENDAMFVVPVSWLSNSTDPGLYTCRWPKNNAVKASRKLKKPSDDWQTCKAHVVHFSRNFEGGNKYLEKYKYSSEVEMFSSEAEKTPSQSLSDSLNVCSTPHKKRCIKPDTAGITVGDFNRLEAKVDCLLKNIAELKEQVCTSADILKLTRHIEQENIIEEFESLKSVCDLEKFEDDLKKEEEFVKAVKQCGSLGGRDVKEAVRRILHKVFCHELAVNVTWIGSSEKISMKRFPKVLQFITVSVRSNRLYKTTPQSDVEDVIKRWFRYAHDRNGGRMKRLKMPM